MTSHTHPNYNVFFYGKDLSGEQLIATHKGALLLKQVHSDKCVRATSTVQNADAHWTNQQLEPLVIQTADCLPVMIYLPLLDTALAIHAGWRGVEQRIVTKSLIALKIKAHDPIHVYIGPHIQKNSFEVDKDVAQQIMGAFRLELSHTICKQRGEKYYIDLASLVVSEIQYLKLNLDILYVSDIDTKTHSDYYSYRAGDRGGRNFSVINKKSAP